MVYLTYYFSEIRVRFIYIVIGWCCAFLLSYIYKLELVYLLSRPLLRFQNKFIFLDLTEALSTTIKIAFIYSFIIILPYIVYQFWSFILPSRYMYERKRINNFLNIFYVLLLIDILFIYFFLFPQICEFFISFEIKSTNLIMSIELAARLRSYTDLLINLLIGFLVFFQIPFLFIYFYSQKWINSYDLCKNRKILLFFSILIASFISPPDLISQIFLALLFFVFFEFLIFIGFFY